MRNIFLVASLLVAPLAGAQSPVLHRLAPLGIPTGKTTEVKLVGERLDEITDVWCSVPEVRVTLTNGPRLMISAPRDAAGIVALRVATTNGISDLAMLMVDELAATLEPTANRTAATAQQLRQPTAIDAITDELNFDYYRFDAKKGETVSVDIVAGRIGSKLDPVLRILDARNQELAFCEDAPGAGRDSRIQFRAPATGEYFIEVRDVGYAGGLQHYYRLRIGQFSFATCTYPLTAAPNTEVQLLGRDKERGRIAARGRYAPGLIPVRYSVATNQVFETEPNDARERSLDVKTPVLINGRFEKSEDRDWFAFTSEKDQRLVFRTKSRSAGSPCDVFLEVRDANGKLVAESNPAGAQDTALTNKFSDAGRYFLVARELAGRGAPDFAYQIEISGYQPGFTLALEDDKFEVKSGGEFNISVSCVRSDFNGKIALQFPGLPEDFAIENAMLDEKKTNATVKIKAPPTAEPGTLIAFSIIGAAEGKQRKASTMPALRRNFPLMLPPPPELDGIVVLGITEGDPAPKPRRRRT